MGLISPPVLPQCLDGEDHFLVFFERPVVGEWSQLVEGTTGSPHTDAAVLSADSEQRSGVGVRADSINMARRRMSRSFLVRGLNDLQILQRSLRGVSPSQRKQLVCGSITGIGHLQVSHDLMPGEWGIT